MTRKQKLTASKNTIKLALGAPPPAASSRHLTLKSLQPASPACLHVVASRPPPRLLSSRLLLPLLVRPRLVCIRPASSSFRPLRNLMIMVTRVMMMVVMMAALAMMLMMMVVILMIVVMMAILSPAGHRHHHYHRHHHHHQPIAHTSAQSAESLATRPAKADRLTPSPPRCFKSRYRLIR